MDLPYLIRRAATSFAETRAVDDGQRRLTTHEAVSRANRLANAFDALGVPPGACVGVLSGNRSEYVEVDLGIALARRVRVALNARLTLEDFRYALTDSKACILIHSAEFDEIATALGRDLDIITIGLDGSATSRGFDYRRLMQDTEATPVLRGGDDEDPAWISYTSGTTGLPKGVTLSHRAIREVAMNVLLELGPVRPGEQLVLTQPLSHGAGYFVLPYLISGAGVYVMQRFDPEVVQHLSRQPHIRTLKIVPAMLNAMLDTPGDFSYQKIVYGASPIPRPILDAALERFGPIMVQIYGQSETPVTITCLHEEDHEGERCNSAGRSWRSVAVEIRDPEGEIVPRGHQGEVTVRGSHTMSGYLGRPEETADVLRDGWIWTKDVGVMDDQGFVYLLGRRDEMINSGGFNIAPREVERVLLDHPAVEECLVLGLPDTQWGNAVTAIVRTRTGAETTQADLQQFVRPRLGFRTPKRVEFVDVIPRTPYGKVDRQAVLRDLTGELEA